MSLSNLNKSTSTNFELVFPVLPTETSLKGTDALVLNIYETVLPSITLDTTDINWMGATVHQDIGSIVYDSWFVNYTVDSKFNNWYTLYKWLTYINNNRDRFGRDPKEYKVDATLRVLDNFRNCIMTATFIGAWVNMLGEVALSYREGTSNLESNINIMYDRFEITKN